MLDSFPSFLNGLCRRAAPQRPSWGSSRGRTLCPEAAASCRPCAPAARASRRSAACRCFRSRLTGGRAALRHAHPAAGSAAWLVRLFLALSPFHTKLPCCLSSSMHAWV
jgi:hypothetical protein